MVLSFTSTLRVFSSYRRAISTADLYSAVIVLVRHWTVAIIRQGLGLLTYNFDLYTGAPSLYCRLEAALFNNPSRLSPIHLAIPLLIAIPSSVS